MTTFSESAAAEEPAPLIYISVPLSALGGAARMESRMWEAAISEAVLDAAVLDAEPWSPRSYSGLDFISGLSLDSEEAASEVFECNSNACWAFADALIAVVVKGGSTGVGIEIGWAISLGIPILYIHPPHEQVSRLIRGMRTEAGIEIASAREPADAFDLVTRFLIKHRAVIEDHRRRREGWEQQLQPLRQRLATTWRTLLEDERRDAAAIAKVSLARIQHLLRSSPAFANASMREVYSLAAALGAELDIRPGLSAAERRALLDASGELQLSGRALLELQAAGESSLAMPRESQHGDLSDAKTWLALATSVFAQ